MQRVPKGYRGTDHETIGSDLLGIVNTLKMPEILLGKELAQQIKSLDPHKWYPISYLQDITQKLQRSQGAIGMRQMGRNLFATSHANHVRAHIKTVRQLFEGWNDVYHRANRGTDIGGWLLREFDSGHAVFDNNTVHDCMLEEGVMLEAIETVGARAMVKQTVCFQQGEDFCQFVITPLNQRAWEAP